MAEAGTFADRVKQQADIVRVVGEYVRLKKSGQNFTGLCPFHSEKTPSFAVHPVRQIYHCFGCGVGGDVFQFVMEMEKCGFPEAVRTVAEKCGIPVPAPRERSPEEKRENQQRAALVEMHREAAAYFRKQLEGTPEGKAARAYLEDRGLDAEALVRFGLGYAPSAGDALLRHLKPKYQDKLIDTCGLFSREQGRTYDRFRRRIMFPIANESGKIVAFGGRALGDDLPKYLNSPETLIYSKSNVLYHLDRAKDAIRRQDFVVLVEGYMDAIAVARAGVSNVVASCGTSLAEPQVKLLARFTRRVVVNYDPDAAGQAATERSLGLLLEQGFDVRVLALPALDGQPADPDTFIRKKGAADYAELLKQAPEYVDYLIARAKQMELATGEGQPAVAGKLRALNFLMPHVQRIPDGLLRSEWATRIAQQLRVDEPVLREALRKAATERRSEVKTRPELAARQGGRPAERRLIKMLAEAEGFREALARALEEEKLYAGLETERLFAALVAACLSGEPLSLAAVANALEERDRRLVYEIVFEDEAEPTWEEAESCLAALRRGKAKTELDAVQREIEALTKASESPEQLRAPLEKKLAERKADSAAQEEELKKKREQSPSDDVRDIQERIKQSQRDLCGPDK